MNVQRFADLVAAGKVTGKRVFIRADLNVPQDDAGRITEDTRIRASIPCIQMALKAGAAVMVSSHLGRPTEGQFKPEDSLAPVAQRLGELLGRKVPLLADWVDGVKVEPGQLDTLLEGLHRVLVVGGDEHHLGQQGIVVAVDRTLGRRQLRDLPRRLHAGEAGHADVEEDDVGAVLRHRLHCLDAVLGLGDDFELGPHLGQAGAELLAHQALVIGEHGARW